MKKNTFFVILFLLVLTSLAVLGYFQQRGKWASGPTQKSGGFYPEFKPEDVRKVTISWRLAKTTLSFKNGSWQVEERESAQAGTAKVVEFLNALSTVTPLKELENCDDDTIQTLRLKDKTPNDVLPGLLVSVSGENGLNFDLIMGAGHFTRDSSRLTGTGTETPNGRYLRLRRPGQPDRIFLCSQVFEQIVPNPSTWLEQLRIEDIRQILDVSVSTQTKDQPSVQLWAVTRPSMVVPFRFLPPHTGMPDNVALGKALEVFAKPFSSDLLPRQSKEIQPEVTLKIRMANGLSYEILMLSAEPVSLAKMNVSFDRQQILPLPRETPEQLSIRTRVLESKAEYAKKSFNGKTFLIPKELPVQIRQVPSAAQRSAGKGL